MLGKNKKNRRRFHGLTMIELVIASFAVAVVILGLGAFLSNVQGNWNRLFTRVYSDSVVDGFAVHKVFDAICRKSSQRKHLLGGDGEWLQLYYWDAGSKAGTPENYALLYAWGGALYVKHGPLAAGTWQPDYFKWTTPIRIIDGVESVKFEVAGSSVWMYLTFENDEMMPVACSAVRHNE